MGRFIARLVAAQDVWARPFGDFNHRWLNALFRPIRPVKDFLNGTWLGHPVHAAVTDLPIGALLLTVILDVLGQNAAADIALVATILFMVGAAVAGGPDRSIAVAVSLVAFLLINAGAYIGGDVVYVLGNMVDRHAFRGAGTKWVTLETGDVADLQTLPEATPTKAKAGINDLVLVRMGDTVHALHAVCAHAGGPLAQGSVVDGCVECPWHGSRFRLTDGHARRGPTVYDQPVYEIRAADGGGYEVRRAAT